MVAISSQYSFGADKAVQISQFVFFDKMTQPKLRHTNLKISLLIWILDLHYERLFWTHLRKISTLLYFLCTRNILFCLEILTFKIVIKVLA